MDVTLAHPEGYGIMPEVEAIAKRNTEAGGGSFTKTGSMAEAFEGADIVYPKSWAPFDAMIFLAKFSNPAEKLLQILKRDRKRVF